MSPNCILLVQALFIAQKLHLSFFINEDLYVIDTGKDMVFVKFAVLGNDFWTLYDPGPSFFCQI